MKLRNVILFLIGIMLVSTVALFLFKNKNNNERVIGFSNFINSSESRQRIDVGNWDLVSENNTKTENNFNDVIAISRMLESCVARFDEDVDIVTDYSNNIVDELHGLPNSERLEALTFLYNEGVFNLQDVTAINEHIIFEEWRSQTPLIEPYQSVGSIDYNTFSTGFTELSEIVNERDLNGLQAWINEYKGLSDVEFEFSPREGSPSTFVSASSLIAISLEYLPENFKDWVFENVTFSPESLHYALMSGVSDEDFRILYTQLESNGQANEFFFEEAGERVSTVLSTVLMHGSVSQLEYILSLPSSTAEGEPFVTPAINLFLERARRRTVLNNEDEEKIRLLNERNFQPTLVFNHEKNWHEFQGIKDRPLSDYDFDWFKSHDIQSDFAPLIDSVYDRPVVNDSIRRAVIVYQDQLQRIQSQKLECDQLVENQADKYPGFYETKDFLNTLDDEQSPSDIFILLESEDPVLVEQYLSNLLYKSNFNVSNEVLVEALIANSEQLNNLKSELLLHEQNHVVAHICLHGTISDLVYLVESGWFADISHPLFAQCKKEKEEVSFAYWEASQSEEAVPSPTYHLIMTDSYEEAYLAVIAGRNIHGVAGGRDAFGLFLDRILPPSAGLLSTTQKNLLFAFLDSASELKDYHYRRLNRLRLKEPTLLDEIRSRYPHFEIENELGLSRFNSRV